LHCIGRSGPNTLLTYFDEGPDRRLTPDDVLFLDFGPVSDGREADYARTYVLGDDPDKKRLVQDLKSAIAAGKRFIVVSQGLHLAYRANAIARYRHPLWQS
jgi:methionine aminopeptidase